MERYGSIESVLWAEIVELGAALDAEREKVKELKEWQRVVVGTGTDQEAVVRMAATEYTKTAVQCWKDENAKLTAQLATLQAQLRQVEGQSKQQAEEAVIVFAKYTTLRQLVSALPVAGLPVEHARSDDFVVLQANGEWMVHTYNYWAKFATEDEARAYIALLEYRASLPAQPAQGGA